MAEDFFNDYRGVLANYSQMIENICSGTILALMITKEGKRFKNGFDDDTFDDSVLSFRKFCGPNEPDLARIVRPNTLRAIFGVDGIKNAVHCTDLSEDGEMECRYFFESLANL